MAIWIIQLECSPPFERPHQRGFIVCVQIDAETPDNPVARFWHRDFQGMDWIQDPPIHEVRTGPSFELPADVAQRILGPILAARLCIAAVGSFGYIHPTQYRLFVQSALFSCKLEWVDLLPTAWQAIEGSVRALEALAEPGARDDA